MQFTGILCNFHGCYCVINHKLGIAMKKLSPDWFFKGLLDIEYKKYLLLAYLKEVNKNFTRSRLYPHLSELVFHYRNLKMFLEHKNDFFDRFPERLTSVDLKQLKLAYEKVIEEDEYMEKIEQIVQYSMNMIKVPMREGRDIHEYVEKQLVLKSVGLVPLRPEEGYIFFRFGEGKKTCVYNYKLSYFKGKNEKYCNLRTRYVRDFENALTTTYESMKSDLIKRHRYLPNPATYAIETNMKLPFRETLFPVAKRLFVRALAANQASS